MLKVNPLKDYGDIRGARYDFEKAGDILSKHVHDETNVHITIVAKGRIKIYSHDWSIEASAGQLVDFRPEEPHEFMALEDDTRIFNIIKKHGGSVNDSYLPQEAQP
jgi:quercetin dioxygenase-like cupin family protein